jgi:hypothetical protein
MKFTVSLAWTTPLPRRSARNRSSVEIVSGRVSAPGTSSASFITLTGLKKWVTATSRRRRKGRPSVMVRSRIPEVLLLTPGAAARSWRTARAWQRGPRRSPSQIQSAEPIAAARSSSKRPGTDQLGPGRLVEQRRPALDDAGHSLIGPRYESHPAAPRGNRPAHRAPRCRCPMVPAPSTATESIRMPPPQECPPMPVPCARSRESGCGRGAVSAPSTPVRKSGVGGRPRRCLCPLAASSNYSALAIN